MTVAAKKDWINGNEESNINKRSFKCFRPILNFMKSTRTNAAYSKNPKSIENKIEFKFLPAQIQHGTVSFPSLGVMDISFMNPRLTRDPFFRFSFVLEIQLSSRKRPDSIIMSRSSGSKKTR